MGSDILDILNDKKEKCIECNNKIIDLGNAYLTYKNNISGFMHKLCYCILHENDGILTREELKYLKEKRNM